MSDTLKIKKVRIEDVKAYESNPRNNSEAVKYVAESIRNFGFKVPVIIDKYGVIVAGHTRVLAAKKLKMAEIPCIVADDLSPEQIRMFRLADNKTAEFSSWDMDLLGSELEALSGLFDFGDFGFSDPASELPGNDDDFDPEKEAENIDDPVSRPGDIWVLGRHRLICGDSCDAATIDKLMDGKKADLYLTDPPYNVNYKGGTKDKLKIENDSMDESNFIAFLTDAFAAADGQMKPSDAMSDTMRNNLNFKINNTLMSRLNDPKTTPVIVIMQRLHEDDTTGFLLNGGTGEHWDQLKMKAIKDDGTALWPAKHTVEMLKRMQAADSYTFAGQYQQEPASPGGNVFKREWFKFYTEATLPAMFDRMVQSWDFTFKNSEGSDNVAGTVWGIRGANRYLLDCVCRRMTFTEQIASMRVMTDKWPKATAKYVEDKANGSAIIDVLKDKIPGIIPVTPTESKTARAMAVTPLFEAGNVWLPEKKIAPWIGDYCDELATFPNAKHDDRVDSTTQALSQTSKNYMRIWD